MLVVVVVAVVVAVVGLGSNPDPLLSATNMGFPVIVEKYIFACRGCSFDTKQGTVDPNGDDDDEETTIGSEGDDGDNDEVGGREDPKRSNASFISNPSHRRRLYRCSDLA